MLTFADALFAYIGDLTELPERVTSRRWRNWAEEPDNRRRLAAAPDSRRHRGGRGAAGRTRRARRLAAAAGGHPGRGRPGHPADPDGTGQGRPAGLRRPRAAPTLVPGPNSPEERRASLADALHGCRAAVGLDDTARRGRRLAALGPAHPHAGRARASSTTTRVTLSEDHLLPLWLLGDPALVQQIAKKYLGPLVGLTTPASAPGSSTPYGSG